MRPRLIQGEAILDDPRAAVAVPEVLALQDDGLLVLLVLDVRSVPG